MSTPRLLTRMIRLALRRPSLLRPTVAMDTTRVTTRMVSQPPTAVADISYTFSQTIMTATLGYSSERIAIVSEVIMMLLTVLFTVLPLFLFNVFKTQGAKLGVGVFFIALFSILAARVRPKYGWLVHL
jgi:hypothetical protein